MTTEQPKEEDVRYIKLLNGEDIIANVRGTDESFLFIERPLKITSSAEEGGYQSQLSRWVPMPVGTVVPIPIYNIIAIVNIVPELEEYYHDYYGILEPSFSRQGPEEKTTGEAPPKLSERQADLYEQVRQRVLKQALDNIQPSANTTFN